MWRECIQIVSTEFLPGQERIIFIITIKLIQFILFSFFILKQKNSNPSKNWILIETVNYCNELIISNKIEFALNCCCFHCASEKSEGDQSFIGKRWPKVVAFVDQSVCMHVDRRWQGANARGNHPVLRRPSSMQTAVLACQWCSFSSHTVAVASGFWILSPWIQLPCRSCCWTCGQDCCKCRSIVTSQRRPWTRTWNPIWRRSGCVSVHSVRKVELVGFSGSCFASWPLSCVALLVLVDSGNAPYCNCTQWCCLCSMPRSAAPKPIDSVNSCISPAIAPPANSFG